MANSQTRDKAHQARAGTRQQLGEQIEELGEAAEQLEEAAEQVAKAVAGQEFQEFERKLNERLSRLDSNINKVSVDATLHTDRSVNRLSEEFHKQLGEVNETLKSFKKTNDEKFEKLSNSLTGLGKVVFNSAGGGISRDDVVKIATEAATKTANKTAEKVAKAIDEAEEQDEAEKKRSLRQRCFSTCDSFTGISEVVKGWGAMASIVNQSTDRRMVVGGIIDPEERAKAIQGGVMFAEGWDQFDPWASAIAAGVLTTAAAYTGSVALMNGVTVGGTTVASAVGMGAAATLGASVGLGAAVFGGVWIYRWLKRTRCRSERIRETQKAIALADYQALMVGKAVVKAMREETEEMVRKATEASETT